MFWNKKRVSVFQGKSFIAAYSAKPFAESKKKYSYPDYRFYKSDDGLYWCVRVGDVEIPWGFGDNGNGYAANGSIIASRRNVDATALDGKGFPYMTSGEVSYLYESEFIHNTFEGFAMYMRDELLVHIREIANRVPSQDFPIALEAVLRDDPKITDLMKSNMLEFKSVKVKKITPTLHS